MPSARLKLCPRETATGLPEVLRTPAGTVLLEIQGQINVGPTPLLRTELDAPGTAAALAEASPALIGDVDLARVDEQGAPVTLAVESQLLRGSVVKLAAPLAVLDVSAGEAPEVPVVDVITHKLVFSKRPEPRAA